MSVNQFVKLGAHNAGLDISSAVELALEDGARYLLIQAITQNARYTLDGTTPEAAVGFQLKAGDPPVLIPILGCSIEIIEEAATCELQYQFGK